MLLLADGVFRLDVVISGDTLRTVIRNLSSGQLEMARGSRGERGFHFSLGDVTPFQPADSTLKFALGAGDDRVEVRVALATLRLPERGTVRITGQAIIRRAPAPS